MAYRDPDKRRAYMREYRAKPEVRERRRKYNARPEVRERERVRAREYYAKPEVKEQRREYNAQRWAEPAARELQRRRRGLPLPTRPAPEHCECCGGRPNGAGALHLDHDHKTGKFRGWLCSLCNTAIGKLGDSVEGLQRAINYLRRTENE